MIFADVTVIRAEKIDLLTVDEIRVIFERKGHAPFEVSEESAGFTQLMQRVLSRFSGSDGRWFEKVAHPAFAPSPTIIWTEEPNQSPEPIPLKRDGSS